MAGYQLQPSGGSALGSLLRKMQEERLNQPASVPQAAGESSPIRAQVQGPLQAPESLGSEKVVSIKAPLSPGQEPGSTVGPVGTTTPVGAPGGVVPPTVLPPVAPVTNGIPGISSPPTGPSFSPTGVQMPSSNPSPSGMVSGASASRAISPSNPVVAKATSPSAPAAPSQPQPSPSPAPKSSGSSNIGGIGTTLVPSILKGLQTVGSSLSNMRSILTPFPLVPTQILNMLKGGLSPRSGGKSVSG